MIALALCVATATDCVVSHWGSWAPCSKTCGCGVQFRSRRLDTPPSPGGLDCPQMVGTRSCNERYCEEGAGGADKATAAALCDVQPVAGTPAPTPRPFFGECHCDPRVDVATDVSCSLEHHTCHYRHDHPLAAQRVPHPTNCDGSVHHSIRVKHIKGVGRRTFRTHMHHICKIVNAGSSDCRCCDCVRERTTSEGCPCGSRAHFFGKRWRYGESPYFFSFRPRPGTTRCEVLGEMTRGGLIEAEEGDMFVEGRLDLDGEYLRFVGNWSEPSDDGCPSFLVREGGGEEGSEGSSEGAGAGGAADVWEQLHTRRCGPLSFHVKDAKLRGSWWYDKYPDFPYTLKWGACNHATASRFSSVCNASYASATDAMPKGAVCTYVDSAKVQMESIVHLLNSSAFTDTRGNVLTAISPSRFEIFMLGAMHQVRLLAHSSSTCGPPTRSRRVLFLLLLLLTHLLLLYLWRDAPGGPQSAARAGRLLRQAGREQGRIHRQARHRSEPAARARLRGPPGGLAPAAARRQRRAGGAFRELLGAQLHQARVPAVLLGQRRARRAVRQLPRPDVQGSAREPALAVDGRALKCAATQCCPPPAIFCRQAGRQADS